MLGLSLNSVIDSAFSTFPLTLIKKKDSFLFPPLSNIASFRGSSKTLPEKSAPQKTVIYGFTE